LKYEVNEEDNVRTQNICSNTTLINHNFFLKSLS